MSSLTNSLPHKSVTNQNNGHAEHIALGSAVTDTPSRTPLRLHVQLAVEQYFAELEGQLPTNLYQTILQEVEKPLLQVVLKQTQENQSKTAKILGLNRGTLRKKMSQYDLL